MKPDFIVSTTSAMVKRFLPESAPQVVQVLLPVPGLEVGLRAPLLGVAQEALNPGDVQDATDGGLPSLEAAEA